MSDNKNKPWKGHRKNRNNNIKNNGNNDSSSTGVDATFRIAIEKYVKEFLENDSSTQFEFPNSFTNLHRKYVHNYCRKLGIKSQSHGHGDSRKLTIYKVALNQNLESSTKLELTENSNQIMFKLLDKFPITTQEKQLLKEGFNFQVQERKISNYRINVSPLSQSENMTIPPNNMNEKCAKQRIELPTFAYKQSILNMIDQSRVLVILGHTGSGKTTQVPQYIMENACKLNQPCRIVCAQPRRISAISVSERVAYERNEPIGTTVGYQIRLESRLSPNSNLIYCTNGVLLRCLMSGNPEELFKNLTHVIIDEVHERDKFTDFLMITIKENLKINPNLKIIIMSATVDASIFTQYFDNCPVMEIPGKLYDVHTFYLEDVLKLTNFTNKKVEELRERFKKNEQHLLREESNKSLALMKSIEEKKYIENLDQETRILLHETMEQICMSQDPEDALNQFYYLLEEDDVPVDVRNEKTGMTVLMIVAGRGLIGHVDTLLKMGADPTVTTVINGRSINAIEVARQFEFTDIIQLLEEHAVQGGQNRETTLDDSKLYEKMLIDIYHDSRSVHDFNRMEFGDEEIDYELIFSLIKNIHSNNIENRGAILVFLPGYEDILQLSNLVMSNLSHLNDYCVFMLHSNMQTEDQKKVFKPMQFGQRKIILATNIAETSITIDDVVFVIDSGKVKQKSFDSISNSSSLQAQYISKACAKQRAGRAGRLQEGFAYRIYSRDRYDHMLDYTVPEILRTPLTEISLQTKLLASDNVSIEEFLMKAMTPPPLPSIRQSIKLLKNIGALDDDENLTQLGAHLADIPVDVQLGKMLIYGIIFKCIDPVLTIVSCLSVSDPFVLPTKDADRRALVDLRKKLSENSFSDHLVLLRIFQQWNNYKSERDYDRDFCQEHFINGGTMERIFGIRSQIIGQLRSVGLVSSQGNLQHLNTNSAKWFVVKACLAAGMYPNVARVDKAKGTMQSQVDKKLSIHMSSVLREKTLIKEKTAFKAYPSEYLVFGEKVRVRVNLTKCNTLIHPVSILLLIGNLHMTPIVEEDDDESDEEEKIEKEPLCDISIDKWITFVADLKTGFLIQELRKKFDALLINFLKHTKKFQFEANENILIEAIVKVLEEEDKATGFPTHIAGLGARPRVFTLKFSSDYNHGTPDFDSNLYAKPLQAFFRDNDNQRDTKQSTSWRGSASEVSSTQMRDLSVGSSSSSQQYYNRNYQQNNSRPKNNFGRTFNSTSRQQQGYTNNDQRRSGMMQQNSQHQTNRKFCYFVIVLPNQGYISDILQKNYIPIDQDWNPDYLNSLMNNEPHKKFSVFFMDFHSRIIYGGGWLGRRNSQMLCNIFNVRDRYVEFRQMKNSDRTMNEIQQRYPQNKIYELNFDIGNRLWKQFNSN